jgi:hypothetical protein
MPGPRRRAALLDLVRTTTAVILAHPDPDSVDMDEGFQAAGFDSLMGIQFCEVIAREVGVRLPTTVVFDHPTPAAFAEHLDSLLAPAAADPPEPEVGVAALLTRLEKALHSVPAAEREPSIGARLLDLHRGWSPRGGTAADDLTAASDDELFSALDDELS